MNLTSSNDSFEFELILSLHFVQCQNSKMENQKSLSSFHELFASKNKIFLAVQNKLQYYRVKKNYKLSNTTRKRQICQVSQFFLSKCWRFLLIFGTSKQMKQNDFSFLLLVPDKIKTHVLLQSLIHILIKPVGMHKHLNR